MFSSKRFHNDLEKNLIFQHLNIEDLMAYNMLTIASKRAGDSLTNKVFILHESIMISRWLTILLILFFITTVSYAESGTELPGHLTKILLDESWNGKKIEVKLGDQIQIELQGTEGTGYAWYFDELDNDFFELIGKERKVQEKSGDLVGSPTLYTWILKAKQIGKSVIKMIYYRVWEGKDKAIRRFEVEVDITP
jgi:predicted secreted protein